MPKKNLDPKQTEALLKTLKARFEINMNRHKGIEWTKVESKLKKDADTLWSLNEMEKTGGEPDVVGYKKKSGNSVEPSFVTDATTNYLLITTELNYYAARGFRGVLKV